MIQSIVKICQFMKEIMNMKVCIGENIVALCFLNDLIKSEKRSRNFYFSLLSTPSFLIIL